MRHGKLAVAGLLLLALGACVERLADAERSRHPPGCGSVGPAAATRAAATEPVAAPLAQQGDTMPVFDHEQMVQHLRSSWAVAGNGFCVACADPSTDTLYLFPEMKAKATQLPELFGISHERWFDEPTQGTARVIRLRPPVRFLRNAQGQLEPGYFDPGHRIFFRWRTAPWEEKDMEFDPATDPISPEVRPERVGETYDIPMPADRQKP